jgi:hypothetical protein
MMRLDSRPSNQERHDQRNYYLLVNVHLNVWVPDLVLPPADAQTFDVPVPAKTISLPSAFDDPEPYQGFSLNVSSLLMFRRFPAGYWRPKDWFASTLTVTDPIIVDWTVLKEGW